MARIIITILLQEKFMDNGQLVRIKKYKNDNKVIKLNIVRIKYNAGIRLSDKANLEYICT